MKPFTASSTNVLMIAAPPLTPAGRFAFIIAGLCHTAAKHGHKSRVETSVIAAVWNRLRRIAVLFAALAAQLQAALSLHRITAPHPPIAGPRGRTTNPPNPASQPASVGSSALPHTKRPPSAANSFISSGNQK